MHGDSDPAFTILVILLIASAVAVFKAPRAMYWIGVIGLFVQGLFFLFKFDVIAGMVQDKPPNWSDGEKVGLVIGMFPFLGPALLAWVTASISNKPLLGLASFTFYSIIQVVVHGVVSEQDELTNKVLTGAKLAIPVLTFIINILRAMGSQ